MAAGPVRKPSPPPAFTSGPSLRVIATGLVCVALLLAGFIGGILTQRSVLNSGGDGEFVDLEAVTRIIDEAYYYRPVTDEGRQELDAEMETGAINGALGTLDDSYTRYLDASESQTAQEDLEGTYGGIGVEVTIDGDYVFVTSVVPGSPAEAVGIIRGDVIDSVDGEQLRTPDRNEAIRALRGDVGERMSVTIVRPSTGAVETYDLTLEKIIVPPVTLTFIEGTTIAWIRITIFGDSTVADLDAAIAQIRERGSTAVILDLRGNGGGWVSEARKTLGRFLDPSLGPAMFEDTTPEEGGMTALPIETSSGVVPLDLPMAVLVDGGTASAAEIVVGALKDYNRATVVGERTFGKGSVQRIFEFSDGSTMRVTVAEWFTPSRGRIQGNGISPDLVVTTGVATTDQDPALLAAVQVLSQPNGTPTAATPVASPLP